MSKPFDLEKALAGQLVKIKGTEEPRRVVGKSYFRDEYIIEDEYGAYRLSLEQIQEGFLMYEEQNMVQQQNGWISADTQPDNEGWYLTYCPNFQNPYVIDRFDMDLGAWLDLEGELTHWMILSQPRGVTVGDK